MGAIVKINSNVAEVQDLFKTALKNALETCGQTCEDYAVINCPVDTSWLSQRITHVVDEGEGAVYIGTNVEYAAYVELGTGIYATQGGGRTTPWNYQDKDGFWHTTYGSPAQPFLKPALNDHLAEYRAILESGLKNG